MNLQEEVDKLLCNAFIGVCHTVYDKSSLAWHLDQDEERMQSIDDLIVELNKEDECNDLPVLRSLEEKGITEVVLIRGW